MMLSRENLCLSLLSHCKTLTSVQQIHALLSKTALDTDPLLAGKFLLHCAITISDHALDYSRCFFAHFPNPDAFMYNTLIRGLSESKAPQDSFPVFNQLRSSTATSPDSFSFAFILKAAANFRSLRSGMQLHCMALAHGLDTHIFVGTTLVSMYAESGQAVSALKMFDELPGPNAVSWNAVITACIRCGDLKRATLMFHKMPCKNSTSYNVLLAGYMKSGEVGLAQNVFAEMPIKSNISWNIMIVGFAHNGCFDEAFSLFRDMQSIGMRPSEVSLTGVLSACADAGAFEFGRILHGLVEKSGFLDIVSVNNALIDTYSKCGNMIMGRLVFETMPERNIVSWTSMIAALAMQGYGSEALDRFHEMEESGIQPDGIAFISILYACSHSGLVEQGCNYFSKMKHIYNIEPTVEHYGCMVDLYGRAGKLEKAYSFISEMPIEATAIIWRTLLGACSIHGNVEMGENVQRRLHKLDPENSGDHVLLSNIYATARQWNYAASVRNSMSDKKIKKSPGWSMIEIDKKIYNFVSGQKPNDVTLLAYDKLKEIMLKLRVEAGYVPEIENVLHDIEDEEKENSVSMHSEKLAVAFGMSKLNKGISIRIVKNLRICRDCHKVMKLICGLYGLEIVVRDRSRFHCFKDGSCSCRDYCHVKLLRRFVRS